MDHRTIDREIEEKVFGNKVEFNYDVSDYVIVSDYKWEDAALMVPFYSVDINTALELLDKVFEGYIIEKNPETKEFICNGKLENGKSYFQISDNLCLAICNLVLLVNKRE